MGLEIHKNKVNTELYAKKISSVSCNTYLIPTLESLWQDTATDLRSSPAHSKPACAAQQDSVLYTATIMKTKQKVY